MFNPVPQIKAVITPNIVPFMRRFYKKANRKGFTKELDARRITPIAQNCNTIADIGMLVDTSHEAVGLEWNKYQVFLMK